MTRVTIVDYLGNLGSVSRALEWLGAEPEVTDAPEKIVAASHLILPGDGAFGYGMQQLRDKELVEPLLEFIASGKPFLGICVGMQLLLSESEEFGHHEGLGVIPGRVVPFPPDSGAGKSFRVPQISAGLSCSHRTDRQTGPPACPRPGKVRSWPTCTRARAFISFIRSWPFPPTRSTGLPTANTVARRFAPWSGKAT